MGKRTEIVMDEYIDVLETIKERITQAQYQVMTNANVERNILFWNIGNVILQYSKWGNKFVETLSKDLRMTYPSRVLMLSWAVMISLCHADMRLPGYLSWNVSFDGADLSAPSRKELVHTSMLCQHFKRRDDGTGICLFHSAVMPEAFLIPEEICQ